MFVTNEMRELGKKNPVIQRDQIGTNEVRRTARTEYGVHTARLVTSAADARLNAQENVLALPTLYTHARTPV